MCRLFSRKCRHKYGAFVDEDQYQYCIKCGVARQVEIPHKHDWKLIRESEVYLYQEKKKKLIIQYIVLEFTNV